MFDRSDTQDQWEPVVVELDQNMAAYIAYVLARDLAGWSDGRRTRLSKEEALSLCMFLRDQLPPERRTPILPADRTEALKKAS